MFTITNAFFIILKNEDPKNGSLCTSGIFSEITVKHWMQLGPKNGSSALVVQKMKYC